MLMSADVLKIVNHYTFDIQNNFPYLAFVIHYQYYITCMVESDGIQANNQYIYETCPTNVVILTIQKQFFFSIDEKHMYALRTTPEGRLG